MKKTVKLVAMLTLALALMLPQLACAEPDEAVKGIYDALTAEDSGYSVALNVDTEAVSEIIDEIPEGCEFAIMRFGKGE